MSHSKVVVFEHADFAGASLEISDDIPVMPSGWNDRISSIRTTTPVTLFQNSNYKGDVLIVNQDTPNLVNVRKRDFNDKVSSIRVRQVYILLNIIQGEFDGTLARSFADINEEVAVANSLFGPYGFNVEVADIRIGGAELYEPKTSEDLSRLRSPFRLPNRLNVTYFTGELFNTASWRWRVQSVKLQHAPGTISNLGVDLHTGLNFLGTVQHCTLDSRTLNVGVRDNVQSIRLSNSTHVTVFSEQNFQGDRRTFRRDVPDLDRYHAITDWWRDGGGHAGGNWADWAQVDLTLRPKEPQWFWLAREVARALALPDTSLADNLLQRQLPSNPNLTIQQAEAAMRHLYNNSALASFFEARR